MRLPRLLLAALVTAAGCSPGFPTEAEINDAFSKLHIRSVDVVALDASGVSGSMYITDAGDPMWHFGGGVSFGNLSPEAVGKQYPMHIHAGRDCDGVNVPIVHDLGAPRSVANAGGLPSATPTEFLLPPDHLVAGYYFDLHAPDDPTGRPLGCALF